MDSTDPTIISSASTSDQPVEEKWLVSFPVLYVVETAEIDLSQNQVEGVPIHDLAVIRLLGTVEEQRIVVAGWPFVIDLVEEMAERIMRRWQHGIR